MLDELIFTVELVLKELLLVLELLVELVDHVL